MVDFLLGEPAGRAARSTATVAVLSLDELPVHAMLVSQSSLNACGILHLRGVHGVLHVRVPASPAAAAFAGNPECTHGIADPGAKQENRGLRRTGGEARI
jgi:hypothetical protein